MVGGEETMKTGGNLPQKGEEGQRSIRQGKVQLGGVSRGGEKSLCRGEGTFAGKTAGEGEGRCRRNVS